MDKIYYATSNQGKISIVKSFFSDLENFEIELVDLDLFEEQTLSLEDVAIAKAKQAWDILQQPVLVDDSGCFFDRYNNFPGTMTKFVYQGLGFEGLYRLYDVGDRASFVTKVAFADTDGIKIFEGKVQGHLIKDANLIGTHSDLPFAQIMIPDGEDRTWYELFKLGNCVKTAPRGKALKKFVEFFQGSIKYV
jgi:XTP/dITP diphosphohydrolase